MYIGKWKGGYGWTWTQTQIQTWTH